MDLPPGARLGPYEIAARLGAGGMGQVYRAHDPRLGRDVAVKTLADRLARDPEGLARFDREARAVAALSHANVIAVHDVGREGDVAYLVMELLEGETLKERLARSRLPWREAAEIGAAVASGLAAAHTRGIVHRDLKPANVFLTVGGGVKILDFGLARQGPAARPEAGGDGETLSRGTVPGTLLGTVDYMSPEQVRGQGVDARSDIFALGSLLLEMVSGQRPFERPTLAETLAAILRDEAPALPRGLPEGFERVVRRCLEKSPARRPETVAVVGLELRSALSVDPATARQGTLHSLAVLSFADMSPEGDQEYFCDGLAEELINALTRVRGLDVASRTSAFRFKKTDLDIRQIGRELGVGAVLEGSVRKAGDRLRITAQLIEVGSGFHLWSERFDRRIEDVFAIQEEISQKIVQALQVTLSEAERDVLGRAPTTDVQAYDLYLRAWSFFHQSRRKDVEFAWQMFARAVERDPGFALAHAGLAHVASWKYMWWGRNPPDLEQALAASQKALELAPDLAEAHSARGIAVSLAGRGEEADREFEAAIAANPRLFEPYYFYARSKFAEGKLEDAVRLYEKASEVHPEDYQAPLLSFTVYNSLGMPEKASEAARRGLAVALKHLELNPDDTRACYLSAAAYLQLGERGKALEWAERALASEPDEGATVYNVCCLYAQAGETEKALGLLARAIDLGLTNRAWLEHDPDLHSLRPDPRFGALLARLPQT